MGTKLDCVFCDRDRIATPITDLDYGPRRFMVFEPLAPVTDGHLLVVPVEHARSAADDPKLAGAAFALAADVGGRYPAFNLVTNVGRHATQTVFHLHVHIVPRWRGDRLALPWSRRCECGGTR